MAETAEPEAAGSNLRVKIVVALVILIIGWLVYKSINKSRVIAGLADADDAVRTKSAQTLMDWKILTDVLSRQAMPVKRAVIGTLRKMNTDATAAELVALMKDRNPTIQNLSQFALVDMQSTSIAKLVGALNNADLNTKNRAVAALIGIGQPVLKPVRDKDGKRGVTLIDTISDAPSRPGIIRVLSAVNGGATPWLVKKVADAKADVAIRACAVEILGRIHAQETGSTIKALLDDPKVDAGIRSSALVALGRLRHPDAYGLLQKALAEADPSVKTTAIVALGELQDPRAVEDLRPYLFGYDETLRDAAVASLTKIGAPAIPALAQLVKNERDEVRRGALRALEAIQDPRVPGLLASALKDPDEDVRRTAADALGHPGDARAVAPLLSALADPAWRVAVKARDSLVMVGPPAVPGLVQTLAKAAPLQACHYAQEALERIGEPAVPALLQTAQQAPASPGGQRAVLALGAIGDNRALGLLQSLSTGGAPAVRAVARRALERFREGGRLG